jgi:hypothetical protein
MWATMTFPSHAGCCLIRNSILYGMPRFVYLLLLNIPLAVRLRALTGTWVCVYIYTYVQAIHLPLIVHSNNMLLPLNLVQHLWPVIPYVILFHEGYNYFSIARGLLPHMGSYARQQYGIAFHKGSHVKVKIDWVSAIYSVQIDSMEYLSATTSHSVLDHP